MPVDLDLLETMMLELKTEAKQRGLPNAHVYALDDIPRKVIPMIRKARAKK